MGTYILKHTLFDNQINKGYTYLPSCIIELYKETENNSFLSIRYQGKYDNKVKIKNELIIDDLIKQNIITQDILSELFIDRFLLNASKTLSSSVKSILNTDNRTICINPFLVKEFLKYKKQYNIDINNTILNNAMLENVKYEFMEVITYNKSHVGKTAKQISKTSEEKRFTSLLDDNFIDYDGIEKYLPLVFDVFKFSLSDNEFTSNGRLKHNGYYYSNKARVIKFRINDDSSIEYVKLSNEEIK